MEFVIRAKKPNEKLWRVLYSDTDLDTSGNISKEGFETEKVAEQYGKIHYAYENTGCTNFQGVMLENGKKLDTEGKIAFEDANHPGDIYLVPNELVSAFLDYMSGEGAAMYKKNTSWVDKLDYVGKVSLDMDADEDAYCPFNIEWDI